MGRGSHYATAVSASARGTGAMPGGTHAAALTVLLIGLGDPAGSPNRPADLRTAIPNAARWR